MKDSTSFFDKPFDPLRLLMIIGIGYIILVLGGKLLEWTNMMEPSEKFPYMAGAASLFIFAMFGSMFIVKAKNVSKYIGRAIYCYLGLVVTTILISWLLTSKPIGEVGSYKWIYLVLTIGFMIFLGIMIFVRNIVEYAEKEEWHHPRQRNRKN
jgi:hypothetical protein